MYYHTARSTTPTQPPLKESARALWMRPRWGIHNTEQPAILQNQPMQPSLLIKLCWMKVYSCAFGSIHDLTQTFQLLQLFTISIAIAIACHRHQCCFWGGSYHLNVLVFDNHLIWKRMRWARLVFARDPLHSTDDPSSIPNTKCIKMSDATDYRYAISCCDHQRAQSRT